MKNNSINNENKATPLLVILAAVFAGMLIISNVFANHFLKIFSWSVDAGTLTFPITYILSDIFSEVYGYKWSRRISWTALGINAVFALLLQLILILPQPEWYEGAAFSDALGSSWRIVAASLVAFCLGDLLDDRIFRRMKRKHENMKGFAVRALTSSFAGHCADTAIFNIIAFSFAVPWREIPGMIAVGIAMKFMYECAVMPMTWNVAKVVKKHEASKV